MISICKLQNYKRNIASCVENIEISASNCFTTGDETDMHKIYKHTHNEYLTQPSDGRTTLRRRRNETRQKS